MLLISILLLAISATADDQQRAEMPVGLARGKRVFETNCVSCHGIKGDGKGPAAAAIRGTKPRDFTKGKFKFGSKPEQLFATITRGIEGTPMPSWAALPEEDRRSVVLYVLNFRKKITRR